MKKANLYFWIIILMLVSTSFYSRILAHTEQVPPAKNLSQFPESIGIWQGKEYSFDAVVLEKLGADDILNRAYRNPQGEITWLYIGYYRSQTRGDQIHSPLHCYPGSGWNPVSSEVVPVSLKDREIRVNRMIIQNGDEKRMVAYWYQVQNEAVANEYMQRLRLVVNAFRKNRTDGSMIRVSRSLQAENHEECWREMVGFVQNAYPLILDFLPQ
jgi:EpsI family protein